VSDKLCFCDLSEICPTSLVLYLSAIMELN
jgi:hypothetical protein